MREIELCARRPDLWCDWSRLFDCSLPPQIKECRLASFSQFSHPFSAVLWAQICPAAPAQNWTKLHKLDKSAVQELHSPRPSKGNMSFWGGNFPWSRKLQVFLKLICSSYDFYLLQTVVGSKSVIVTSTFGIKL